MALQLWYFCPRSDTDHWLSRECRINTFSFAREQQDARRIGAYSIETPYRYRDRHSVGVSTVQRAILLSVNGARWREEQDSAEKNLTEEEYGLEVSRKREREREKGTGDGEKKGDAIFTEEAGCAASRLLTASLRGVKVALLTSLDRSASTKIAIGTSSCLLPFPSTFPHLQPFHSLSANRPEKLERGIRTSCFNLPSLSRTFIFLSPSPPLRIRPFVRLAIGTVLSPREWHGLLLCDKLLWRLYKGFPCCILSASS